MRSDRTRIDVASVDSPILRKLPLVAVMSANDILLCTYTHQGCTMVTVLDPAGVLPTAVQGGRINERPGIQ